jgi:hypothetical protein
LPAVGFDAAVLGIAVTTVFCGTLTFFVCHVSPENVSWDGGPDG